MKITRTICSTDPAKCNMIARGFFGNVIGEVKYAPYGIEGLDNRKGYFVMAHGELRYSATDFLHACDSLLIELNILKTQCI